MDCCMLRWSWCRFLLCGCCHIHCSLEFVFLGHSIRCRLVVPSTFQEAVFDRNDIFVDESKEGWTLEWQGEALLGKFLLRKIHRLDQWKDEVLFEPNRKTIQINFTYGFVKLLRAVPVWIFIRLVRNALWINVTIVSSASSILRLSVRTRATTILHAVLSRRRLEKKSGFLKGSVYVNIGEQHRKLEENMDTTHQYHYQPRTEKYWQYWNDLDYDPRYFKMNEESRTVQGRVKTFEFGLFANPMGENRGFLLDTGDHVLMKEVPGADSTISFISSEGVEVLLPLSCAECKSLVHWIWQHSIDTVYGALERRDDFVIDRNVFEMDIGLFVIGIAIRQFIIHYFGIVTNPLESRASDPVSICLLHLSILAALYTIRQSYLKDWFKYKGKRVSSELCYLTLPHRGLTRLSELLRKIVGAEGFEEKRDVVPPVFIGNTNEDLFLNAVWGIDCKNPEIWKISQELNNHSVTIWFPVSLKRIISSPDPCFFLKSRKEFALTLFYPFFAMQELKRLLISVSSPRERVLEVANWDIVKDHVAGVRCALDYRQCRADFRHQPWAKCWFTESWWVRENGKLVLNDFPSKLYSTYLCTHWTMLEIVTKGLVVHFITIKTL